MEQNNHQFRLRLNLFDGIVLLAVVAVAGLLLWTRLKPQPTVEQPAANTTVVRYNVTFRSWMEGTDSMIEIGDKLVDNIKNYEIGTVVAKEVGPVETLVLNHGERQYVLSDFPGYEDISVTVEAPCTITDEAITLGGGYALRVGATAYIRGEGYMASGPITYIDREGLEK